MKTVKQRVAEIRLAAETTLHPNLHRRLLEIADEFERVSDELGYLLAERDEDETAAEASGDATGH